MSEQIPLPAAISSGLPEVAIDDRALARFTIEMVGQLHDLERRFVEPRKHPRIVFEQSRRVSRRPR